MNDNLITKDSFYIFEITKFDYLDYDGALHAREENVEHKAFIVQGIIFDFETGEEIRFLQTDEMGYVNSQVYSGVPYIISNYAMKLEKEDVTNADIKRANKIVDTYLLNKELKGQGKLVKFKGKRLY